MGALAEQGDVTNASEPTAGGRLGGETARDYAIKRFQKQAQSFGSLKPQAPNTGPTGLPKKRMG